VSNDLSGGRSVLRPGELYVLRLYVAGSTPQSSRAITNLKALCETHLRGRYELTVVDLYEHRERAQQDQILVIPTLVRQSPGPVRRILGDLSHTDRVLAALGLAGHSP
jgi:circadian clock protein KaiB